VNYRHVACILAFAIAVPSLASAQTRRRRPPAEPAPVAEPAPAVEAAPEPAPATAPAAAEPAPAPATAPAPAEEPASEGSGFGLTDPQRRGPFVDGGLWLTAHGGSQSWIRVEGGFPLSSSLSLLLPLMYAPERVDVPGYRATSHSLLLLPGVRYSFTLYAGAGGDFAPFVEGGVGAGIVRSKVDGFGGQSTSTHWLGAARVGGGATYVAPFGLSCTLQPFGLAVFFDENGASAAYDFSLMIGYRGR